MQRALAGWWGIEHVHFHFLCGIMRRYAMPADIQVLPHILLAIAYAYEGWIVDYYYRSRRLRSMAHISKINDVLNAHIHEESFTVPYNIIMFFF